MKEALPAAEPTGKEFERKKRILFELAKTRASWHINHVRREHEDWPEDRVFREALAKFEERLTVIMPEHEQELHSIFTGCLANLGNTKNEVEDSIAHETADFIASNYSFEEIEAIARRNPSYENFHVNRLIEYGITDDELHMHVPVTFVQNPMELRTLFYDALRTIAHRLQTDSALENIKTITARSWIVPRAKRGFTDAGFTIVDISPDGRGGVAEISRKDLMDRYGK